MGKKYNYPNGLTIWIPLLITWLTMGTLGEFRFCYFGPQKFQNKDCPFGLFIPRPIRTSCVYYANDQTGPSGEAELQSCSRPPETLSSGGERLNDVHLQALFLDIADPNENGELGQLDGDECATECLSEYRSMDENSNVFGNFNDPEEPEYDDMLDPLSEYGVSAHKNLTAELFLNLLEEDHEPELVYLRSAQLLKKSMKILTTICAPYISQEFMQEVFNGFLFLILKSNDSVSDIGIIEQDVISKALSRCELQVPPKIQGIVCDDYSKIVSYQEADATVHKYTKREKSFRWGKYDPIVESAWAAVDFVHGFCPPVHVPNFNFHHAYEAALEPLFTRTIMQRWPNPPVLKRGFGYWNNLLAVKDAQLMMRNLDACVQAGYSASIYKERLNRPFTKFPKLMGLARPPSSNDHGEANDQGTHTGWTGDLAEYWAMYKSNDGFNKFLERVGGVCIKTEDALNSIRAQSDRFCGS